MSVASEIREEQKKALKTMTTKQKLAYFWEYYKIHTFVVIAIIGFIALFIQQQASRKDLVFAAYVLNIVDGENAISDQLEEEFAAYEQIDTKKQDVSIDTSLFLAGNGETVSPYTMQAQQKMVVMLQTGEINVLIGDFEGVEEYAKFGYCTDLRLILSKEELEHYKDRLYYTDNKTIEMLHDSVADDTTLAEVKAKIVNHMDPSTMEDPIPTGILISDAAKIKELAIYDYLAESKLTFQGYPTGVLFTVPVSAKEPTVALDFLRYLEGN